jgi:hypothetical protein
LMVITSSKEKYQPRMACYPTEIWLFLLKMQINWI